MNSSAFILLISLLTACPGHLEADFDRNGVVDFKDFVAFAEQWLKQEPAVISLRSCYEYDCNSISYLEGHEYPPGIPRIVDMAFCNVSDGIFESNEYDDQTSIRALTQNKEGTFYATNRWARNLYKSTDGRTWTFVAATDFMVAQLWALADGVLLMVKGEDNPPKIYRSVDEGINWTQVLTYAVDSRIRSWSVTQAPHGTIVAVEYSRDPNHGRNIYRSIDEGVSWANVYHETGDITHFHLATYHSVTGIWLAQCGDNEPRRKILKSIDDGETWQVWPPHAQGKEFFNTAQMLDYEDPTKLFFADDAGSMVGFLDVTNGNVTQKYFDHDQRVDRHLVFSAFYYQGMFYGAFFEQGAPPYDATIIASEDAENWVVYHRFTPDDGNNFVGISGFVGVGRGDGKIHCDTPGAVTRHFTISPANVNKTRAILLEPGTTNLLDTPEKSSIEVDGSGMAVLQQGVSGARSVTEHSHGSASYNISGPLNPSRYGFDIASTVSITPTENSVYWGSFKMKGATLFRALPRWLVGNGLYSGYETISVAVGHSWATYYLPPYKAPAGGGPPLRLDTFVFGESNNPYDVDIDDLQFVKDETPTSWQLGGVPRNDTTYSCNMTLPEAWTNVFYIFPEFYYKLMEGTGRLFIRSWVKDAGNYVELYFDCSDNKFKLRRTVSGVGQPPVESEEQTFQRKALIRLALRCSPNNLTLSIINGRSSAEHLVDTAFACLHSNEVTIKYGNKDGSNGFPLFLAIDSDLLYESVEDDLTTITRMGNLWVLRSIPKGRR